MNEIHTVASHHNTPSFSPDHRPILTVSSGSRVRIDTDDSPYERLARGESFHSIGLDAFNSVTGPVAVEGAEPGDILRIKILEIRIHRAWAAWIRNFGPLGQRTNATRVESLEVVQGRLQLPGNRWIPLSPSIGCIGLAPASGDSSTVSPVYPWGGNLDFPELSQGATLSLPVQANGGLLSLGDLHAVMGAGEPTSVAIEAAGSVTVELGLEKHGSLSGPRIHRKGETLFLGLGSDLEEAREKAILRAFRFLEAEQGMEGFEAYAYCSARVSLRIGGPASCMVLASVPDP